MAEQSRCCGEANLCEQARGCLIHIAFFVYTRKISYFALLLVYLSNLSWLHSEMDYEKALPQW